MTIFYLVIIALSLYGLKVCRDYINEDFLDKTQSDAIKGIFILIVFMRHVVPYVIKAGYEMDSCLDKIFTIIDNQIGQLLVVMFLFYSGYGVMESIKRKGDEYIRNIPKHRLLTTFLNFDIAVAIYLLVDFSFGIEVKTEQYFLSRFGWDSVGNSNWYIFIILLLYSLTYISYKLCRRGGIFLLIILSVLAVITLMFLKDSWWYNTLLSYPAGILLSVYKEKFKSIVVSKYSRSLMVSVLLFLFLHGINMMNHILPKFIYSFTYNIEGVSLAIFIVIGTMKISVGNRALVWLGANLFPLYIYQRIPMIAIREIASPNWLCLHPYLFIAVSFIFAIVITHLYKYWKLTI